MAMTDPFEHFAVAVGLSADHRLVTVTGEVNLLTVPVLRATLGSVAVAAGPGLILDLSQLTFLGPDGHLVIDEAAQQLQRSGKTLTIRGAPSQVRRLFEITERPAPVRFESAPVSSTLGAEQRDGDETQAVAPPTTDLATDLVRSGIVSTSHGVVDTALRLVTTLAQATIEGADGVSVSLQRHGRLTTVAASNETVRHMDAHQYRTGEGPCVAAATKGRWFHVQSLADEHRWPAFIPPARDEGIASILSTPLIADRRPLGALNIYSSREGAFGQPQQELAALFATQASGIVVDAHAGITDDALAVRVTDALAARQEIAWAQGIVMARTGATAEAATARIHREARRTGRPVREHAADLVESVTPPELPGGASDHA
jgi:anti-anti-sigma factor